MCDPILVTLLKMQPHYSQSSRENATPSSGTSPVASYKEVPPPREMITVPSTLRLRNLKTPVCKTFSVRAKTQIPPVCSVFSKSCLFLTDSADCGNKATFSRLFSVMWKRPNAYVACPVFALCIKQKTGRATYGTVINFDNPMTSQHGGNS